MRTNRLFAPLAALVVLPLTAAAQPAATTDPAVEVDRIFAEWDTNASPGCAVAVEDDGTLVLERAYGMADLEHDIPNTPNTLFEAGSVSKQFTAAAVVLLALDGKLSLDDDIRKYVPEVPQYEWPITIRHLLTHTSGLRDWGSVAAISGWERGSRVHTHAHVLEILSRQSALNFQPGHEYSYSNSGYNLLAIIAERVSGMSLPEFTRQRIFEPLGMTRTQWRDDYTRIVKDRAIAYAREEDRYVLDMPFENVYGNAALLTTVGDLLKWNRNLNTGEVGGPRFLEMMHDQGVLNDGTRISYAAGLQVNEFRGVPVVSHTGSTAGYRAFLARYPDQQLSIALLCNTGNANPGRLGAQVAEVFLGDVLEPAVANGDREEPRPNYTPTDADLAAYPGEYHSDDAETTLTVALEEGALVIHRRPDSRFVLTPIARDRFESRLGEITFRRDESGRVEALSVRQSRVYDMRFQRVR